MVRVPDLAPTRVPAWALIAHLAGSPGRDLDAVPAWGALAADAAPEWGLGVVPGWAAEWAVQEWAAARMPGRNGPIRLGRKRPSPTNRRQRAESIADFVTTSG